MNLSDLLGARRRAIVDQAAAALDRAHLAHYEAAGGELRRARLERLYDLVAQAVAERNLTAIQHHGASVAQERFTAGFDLLEVQSAFNVLEEALWRTLVAEVPAAELGEALGLVGTALGAGKDRLAATYVELASRTRTPSLDLRALFAGTAGV
jgi:hypothetical protein